jgi:hypothetical protein
MRTTNTLWYISAMQAPSPEDFAQLYAGFHSPIAELDCGRKCAPYNEYGVPFCCDPRHTIPSAYKAEWAYLQANTDHWRRWQAPDPQATAALEAETPPGLLLIVCKGVTHCQREFRSISCRAFPFFPYLDSQGEFLGLSVYTDYEDRCWVINHLQVVSKEFRNQCIAAYETLFRLIPQERETFAHHSATIRLKFQPVRRPIVLLHRDGFTYTIQPDDEHMRRVSPESLPKYGPYRIAASLPFPDETPTVNDGQQIINNAY